MNYKVQLLQLTKRPHWRTKLGQAFNNYTSKSHNAYDPVFDKKIRELKPDWFRDLAAEKKEELLRQALAGAARPRQSENLGKALSGYVCGSASSFDTVFDRKIRKLRPDWFKKRGIAMSDTITVKRNVLGDLNVRVRRAPPGKPRNLYNYQSRIVNGHLLSHDRTSTEAPTGSGKSTIILSLAIDKIKAGRRPIIISPKLGINAGFTKYTSDSDFRVGKRVLPAGSIVEADGTKSEHVSDWVRRPSSGIMVCSYQSIRHTLKSKNKQVRAALKNVVLLVDEVHHSAYDNPDNMLGGIIGLALKSCAEVHVFTATAFRTDGSALVNGEFAHYRRTLKEHHDDGYCPNFGIFIKFYQKVDKVKFDEFEESRKIGSSKALIASYIKEFTDNRLPTLMLVDSARQAKALYDALKSTFKGLNIVNLGSEDGRTLESTLSRIKRKFKKLDSDERIDVVIAIKVSDEGLDWPDCAQTFSPRVSSSLVLLVQRAIGRAMRRKRKGHISPNYSRVVLFEVGILDDDKSIVAGSLFALAVRLKALCEGLDFADEFKFKLPKRARDEIDEQKSDARSELNMSIMNLIQQDLIRAATGGASQEELVELCIESYSEEGCELSAITAYELLIQMRVIVPEDDMSRLAAARLIGRLADMTFAELKNNKQFKRLMNLMVVRGVADYVGMLGVDGEMGEIARILREHLKSSSDKNKEILLQIARAGLGIDNG